MTARPVRRLLAFLLLTLGCALSFAQPRDVPPVPEGRARLVVPEAREAVRIDSVEVRATVSGTVARSRIELVLHNPNDRVLEGQLQFPLLDGQVVSGFALDIDGRLRDAVAVPKAQARRVFDDVTRQRVDPALLQMAQGHFHSLRVYPLPPRGTRRVMLELTQTLDLRPDGRGGAQAVYRLPLDFGGRVASQSLELRLSGIAARHVHARLRSRSLVPVADGDGLVLRHRASNVEGADLLELRLDQQGRGPAVATQDFRGRTYAYAELPAPRDLPTAARPRPRSVGLVWDASASAARRDRAKELALLDRWFRQLDSVAVQLKVVRDEAEPPQAFQVEGGDWSALRRRLEDAVPDGATNLGAMSAPAGSEIALLFTDGVGNVGDAALAPAAVPVMAVSSSTGVETARLRRHAEDSGGEHIDLLRLELPEALRLLGTQRTRIAGLDAEGATELVAASRYPDGGRFIVAALLTQPQAELRLRLLQPDGRQRIERVAVRHDARTAPATPGIAAQQWARLRWEELSADETRHRARMDRLGLQFNLLTPRTSLLVLDDPADYVRHGIEPPPGDPALVQAVERLAALRPPADGPPLQARLAQLTQAFNERVRWWEHSFPKDGPPSKPAAADRGAFQGERLARESAPAPAPAGMAPPPPAAAPMAAPAPAPAPAGASPAGGPGGAQEVQIALRRWQPDSAYARRMRSAAPGEAYAVYLDERGGYENSTAFFLDAADILMDKGQPALAARVLSNLAEMQLEERHVLRILAYRLLQWERVAAALPILERVLELAPDEPQSWRDLGLALAAAGQAQRAVDALWHVATQPQDMRFGDMRLIALVELNAVAAQARERGVAVDTSAIPAELQRNLPVALRTVLSWDADNTDIDLWVTDPDGERAFYGHRFTYQGGLVSRDVTGGYGPEEFVLRAPKPGRYKVQANFYGHRQQIVAPATTLMLDFVTGFGSADEKRQRIVLRLSGSNRMVDVGEFEVAEPK